jgi:hypothetical protein
VPQTSPTAVSFVSELFCVSRYLISKLSLWLSPHPETGFPRGVSVGESKGGYLSVKFFRQFVGPL